MLGSQNAAFDLWMKDMPPPLKKEEEEEESADTGFMPDRNPYGGGQKMEGASAEGAATEGSTGITGFGKSKRSSSFRAYDGHVRGQDMDTVGEDEEVVVEHELVHIQGEVGTTVKDGNNYLMLTCIILLLLGIGLALFAYNNRKAKVEAHYHTLRNDAYGSV